MTAVFGICEERVSDRVSLAVVRHVLPPEVRGGLAARLSSLMVGLFLCALSIVFFLEADVGLSPWDVLHQGIAEHTPLSFGLSSIAVGIVVLGAGFALGARPGFGTVANALLIGVFIDLLRRSSEIQSLSELGLAPRVGLMLAGILLFGVGTAFYIGAALGAGPRDSLMLVISVRSGARVGIARAALELSALGAGAALGGSIGIGTLAFALLIGPSVELGFFVLGRSPLAVPRAAAAVAQLSDGSGGISERTA